MSATLSTATANARDAGTTVVAVVPAIRELGGEDSNP